MHKNSNLRTRNAPSLKITLTSGAFFRVHISIYYNVKTKQSETFPSKLPDTNLDCPAVKHTYIMHWANGRTQTKTNWNRGIYFLNTRSRYLGGFQRTASCPTLTDVLGDSLVKAERRIQHQQRFEISPLFLSNEPFSLFIICYLDIINLLQALDFRSSRTDISTCKSGWWTKRKYLKRMSYISHQPPCIRAR